jgi:hypothetical protein
MRRVFVLLAVAVVGWAGPLPDVIADKSRGDVVILPGLLGDSSGHYPGWEYKSGGGWWALHCMGECVLSEQRLDVSALDHPTYDGDPVPGQVLTFSPERPVSTLLLFKPIRSMRQLKLAAGPVVTYFRPGQVDGVQRPADSPGTMEWEVLVEGNPPLRFVPVVAERGAPLQLEVELGGRRQLLGKFNFAPPDPFPMSLSDYLLWVGDLDGDGRPDLLVNLDFHGTDIALFLSSAARGEEIAHEVGRFKYFPIAIAGC